MTPSETVHMVRMLIDDSRDWFPTLEYVNSAINEAQIMVIKKLYALQEERGLRTLYRETGYIPNGSIIQSQDSEPRKLLFPRVCRKKSLITHSDNTSHIITYIDKNVYLNYITRDDREGKRQPRFSYYTIIKEIRDDELFDILYFSSKTSEEVANLWFISYPPKFIYENKPNTDVGLSLPDEYHFDIVTLAAEIINDIDVGEIERGQFIPENQRLNLEGLSL